MAYIWRETFSNIKHSGVMGTFSIIIVALTMMVFNTLLIVVNYLNTEIGSMKRSPFVVAFLQDGLDDQQRQAIQAKISNLPQVSIVKYISKEDALLKSAEMFANRKEILEGLESMNPLPSSFEIEINELFLDDVKEVAERIKRFDGIEDVQHAEKASVFIKSIQTVILAVLLVLGFASVLIIWFSIMTTAHVRREEIRIIRLIGGTNVYIRFPLLLQGIMQGLIGSILGLGILYGLFYLFGIFNLLAIDITFTSFLTFNQLAIIIGAGAFIGFVGGAVPLRKLVRI